MPATTLKLEKIPHHEPSTLRDYDDIVKPMTANARAITRVHGHNTAGCRLCGHVRDTDQAIMDLLGISKIGLALEKDIPAEAYPMIEKMRSLYDDLIRFANAPKPQPLGDFAE